MNNLKGFISKKHISYHTIQNIPQVLLFISVHFVLNKRILKITKQLFCKPNFKYYLKN